MSRPIKILVISNYNSFVSSRPEAAIFLGLKQKGVDVEIITDAESEHAQKFKAAGIPVIDALPKKKFSKKSVELIKNRLEKGKHDILLLYNSKAIINGIKAAKNLPVKVVLYRGYTGNIHWWDPTAYAKFLHPRVDKIICNAKAIQELFEKQLFFKKGKAVTINKGHDLNWYRAIEKTDLSEFGIPENAFVVSCVANARRMKGIKYLVKAMDYIPQAMPLHLLLVGKGLDSPDILKIVNKSPNKDKIHFAGYRKDGLNIVKASNVFALASITGESITKAVIEAMSIGIAPLITDIAGNRELVVNGESGIVVPSKNPEALAKGMIRLYENPELCEKYGQNAQERIDQVFNTKRTVEEYLKLFENLVK
ncbi:MAG: glycosyltransferase family 4 protein [Chitinophagales bacterium]